MIFNWYFILLDFLNNIFYILSICIIPKYKLALFHIMNDICIFDLVKQYIIHLVSLIIHGFFSFCFRITIIEIEISECQ